MINRNFGPRGLVWLPGPAHTHVRVGENGCFLAARVPCFRAVVDFPYEEHTLDDWVRIAQGSSMSCLASITWSFRWVPSRLSKMGIATTGRYSMQTLARKAPTGTLLWFTRLIVRTRTSPAGTPCSSMKLRKKKSDPNAPSGAYIKFGGVQCAHGGGHCHCSIPASIGWLSFREGSKTYTDALRSSCRGRGQGCCGMYCGSDARARKHP